MRNMRKWAGLAAVLCLLVACNEREVDNQDPLAVTKAEKTIHFRSRNIDTKAAFDDAVENNGKVTYPAFWTDSDDAVMISLNYEYAVTAGVNASKTDENGRIEQVAFDASFSGVDTESPYRFYVVTPASALLWTSADRAAVSVHVLANQTPSKKSVDEKAMIFAGLSDSFKDLPDDVDVYFRHITSYGKMTLNNLDIPKDASLTSITLVCEEQPLSGAWYYKFEDGSVEEKEASSSIVLNTEKIDVAGGDPVWFACAPVGTGLAGKSLTIRANLNNGTALVRTIKLHDSVNYKSGRVTKFSVNMASAETVIQSMVTEEEVYELVTKITNLAKEDEVIIVDSSKSPAHAMTSTSSTSGISATSSGFEVGSDGYIRLSSDSSVLPLKVYDISGSSVEFYDGDSKYLAYASSGQSRYLNLGSSSTAWTVAISDGAATISYRISGIMGSSTYYYVRYNNNYFSLTTSSNTVALYKKKKVTSTSTVDFSADPVCGYSTYGAYLSDQNLVYNASTDQLNREYDSDGTLTFAILAPVEDQVVEFSGIPSKVVLGDKFSLHLTYISGISTKVDRRFSVYVVKEEGHSLWLSDGSGNGFIVKR